MRALPWAGQLCPAASAGLVDVDGRAPTPQAAVRSATPASHWRLTRRPHDREGRTPPHIGIYVCGAAHVTYDGADPGRFAADLP